MYTLITSTGLRKGVLAEGPSLLFSFVVAEIFYKFHSFTLESVAFLVTWFAASYLQARVRNALVAWRHRPLNT